jgi:hypothetical protein
MITRFLLHSRWILPLLAAMVSATAAPRTLPAQAAIGRIVSGPLTPLAERGVLFEEAEPAVQDTVRRNLHPTYWAEGVLIGGGAAGFLMGAVFTAICDLGESGDPNCLGAGQAGILGGVLLAGVPAALIGSAFKKQVPAPGSVRRGNKGLLGALAFGIPSAAIEIAGTNYYCHRSSSIVFSYHPCSAGKIASSLLIGVVNSGVGYLIGRAIPKWGPPPSP